MTRELCGYMGKILRVDLTDGSIKEEPLEPEMADRYLGGSGFGAEYPLPGSPSRGGMG